MFIAFPPFVFERKSRAMAPWLVVNQAVKPTAAHEKLAELGCRAAFVWL